MVKKVPDDDLRLLHEAGVSQSKIAVHFGCHLRTVRVRERVLGLSPRQPGLRSTPDPQTILEGEPHASTDL